MFALVIDRPFEVYFPSKASKMWTSWVSSPGKSLRFEWSSSSSSNLGTRKKDQFNTNWKIYMCWFRAVGCFNPKSTSNQNMGGCVLSSEVKWCERTVGSVRLEELSQKGKKVKRADGKRLKSVCRLCWIVLAWVVDGATEKRHVGNQCKYLS